MKIRALRGKLTNDDYLALATLLVKAGYAVRLTSDLKPGGKTRETVLEFEEEPSDCRDKRKDW